MARRRRARGSLLLAAYYGVAGAALADPSPVVSTGLPPQIVPSAAEVGVTIMTMPGSGNDTSGATGTGTGATTGGGLSTGSGNAYAALMSTAYGNAAVSDAQQAGVNVNALADIGQAESGFQNIPTANGSSSATGPWQITTPTFNDINQKYGLGYSASDITDPTAQAQVASYIIKDYAGTVSQATGEPATVLQTYGAYVFGATPGAQIAAADSSAPLSNYVSATALANNNMTGWTVGQFQSTMSSRLGSTANQTVLTSA
jgi:muramidase (phage lysozyme)